MNSHPHPTPSSKAPVATQDAIALLRADHADVSALFAAYGKASLAKEKKALVSQICAALRVHAQIEEEIFYPAVQKALGDTLLVPEARVEHTSLKSLIAQIDGVQPDGEQYEARVKVLSEYVKHHVQEEQSEMFPKVKASDLDLAVLGGRMATRKDELVAAASKRETSP